MATARELIRDASKELEESSLDPTLDAQILLAEILETTRTHVLLIDEISDADISKFKEFINRRKNSEPIQYITGRAYFRNLTLDVGPGVLVPRPESEGLVTAVIDAISMLANPKVLDLGAGSGALGIALAEEVPGATVYSVEKDAVAFGWLERNVAKSRASINTIHSDVIDFDGQGSFDAVIANPPYIPSSSNLNELPEEVGKFEPAIALFGGKEGLDGPRLFIDCAIRSLHSAGYLAVEHHESHGEQIALLLKRDCLDVTLHYDLNGRPRWSSGVRR